MDCDHPGPADGIAQPFFFNECLDHFRSQISQGRDGSKARAFSGEAWGDMEV